MLIFNINILIFQKKTLNKFKVKSFSQIVKRKYLIKVLC